MADKNKITPLDTITMQELFENVYCTNAAVIKDLLYPGTYLLAGSPKIGKSFFVAQLAYHVSTGTPLWDLPTRKGKVLYLALEDTYRRLQERMYRMFGTETTDLLHFSVSAGKLTNGLEEQIQLFLDEHPDTTFVMIDTLQKIRDEESDSTYANDYKVITRLKNLSDKHGICILVVHHTRKLQSDDKYDMISGTNGLFGAADGALILQKEKRTSNKATLDVSGRDQPDLLFHLIRNEEQLVWELEEMETQLWKENPTRFLKKLQKKLFTKSFYRLVTGMI